MCYSIPLNYFSDCRLTSSYFGDADPGGVSGARCGGPEMTNTSGEGGAGPLHSGV